MKKEILLSIIIIVIIVAGGLLYWNKENNKIKENIAPQSQNENTNINPQQNNTTAPKENSGIANPASTYCKDKGGVLKIEKKPDGSEYGLCYFEDNRACEEWAMMRGECPIGGRKTTGYDTIAQSFCAWSGGSTLAEENAKCTFSDGSVCLDEDFYNGKCQKGDSLKK